MKIKLEFKSPFIIGGRKLTNNFIESIDYIPGNVLRAAFARYILINCSENSIDYEIDGEIKKNWVYFRGREGCVNCNFKSLCKKFKEIRFSYFYPQGTKNMPLTAMQCKDNPKHGFIDCLIKSSSNNCAICKGRMEFAKGYVKDGNEYNVKKTFITKTEIDRYTKTSKDGSLYSLVAVSETDNGEIIYEGKIEGINEEELKLIEELRVGKYISVGFGKCKATSLYEINSDKDAILKNLKEFDKMYKDFNEKNKENYKYFSIKFIADAKVNFNLDESKYYDTNEYKKIWKDALNINEAFKIDKIYAETFEYRGYDMSKVIDDKRESTVTMVQKGSVIVFETEKDFNFVLNYFNSIKGLGEENENGFGEFQFYFGGVVND